MRGALSPSQFLPEPLLCLLKGVIKQSDPTFQGNSRLRSENCFFSPPKCFHMKSNYCCWIINISNLDTMIQLWENLQDKSHGWQSGQQISSWFMSCTYYYELFLIQVTSFVNLSLIGGGLLLVRFGQICAYGIWCQSID